MFTCLKNVKIRVEIIVVRNVRIYYLCFMHESMYALHRGALLRIVFSFTIKCTRHRYNTLIVRGSKNEFPPAHPHQLYINRIVFSPKRFTTFTVKEIEINRILYTIIITVHTTIFVGRV